MFTCSSCGYEANPDSAPACSLCGTKRPVKAGAKEEPKPAAASASASPAPSASGSGASKSSPKTEPKAESKPAAKPAAKPAGKADDHLDELAKAVAESAESAPTTSDRGARAGRPAAGTGQVVVTSTGILRMSAPAPAIDNALTMMGTFVGALLGYAFCWYHVGAAPASLGEVWIAAVAAAVFALIFRFALAPTLEESLGYDAKVTLHGPGAGATGGALAILALVGFFAASRNAPGKAAQSAPTANLAAVDGVTLAQRLALMTPWTCTLRTDKVVILAWKGKPEVRLPATKLGPDDIANVVKITGLSREVLDRLAGADPSTAATGSPALPAEFSLEVFLDRVGTVYGVLKDQPRAKETRTGTLLSRRRKNGSDELLGLPVPPRVPFDLQSALPSGVPPWVGVSLGIPHDATSDHDALVNAVYDKYRPND